MAATEPRGPGGGAGRRRFVTRHHVEDAARSGTPIVVSGRDVVTDEAAQRAEDLGVRIEREGAARRTPGGPPAPAAGPPATEALRAAVRSAVVAELGREPEGLEAAIDRALRRRGR
ncbi:hypothetical protein GCM10023168_04420 [Fodinibacter luteus]|uniref:Uncharacterized protein n=1 Tax=Fodinibacter luteus TaxID=552064 RepID=A0ABP8JZN7_9MICO